MVKKIIGYIFSILGILGISSVLISPIGEMLSLPETLTKTNILTASAVLILLGIFLIRSKKGQANKIFSEVPIYQGKSIVGYRRQ